MKNKILVAITTFVFIAMLPLKAISAGTDTPTIVLSKENTMILNNPVDGESVGQVISKAKELDDNLNSGVAARISGNKKPLYLFLNTPGGSVQAGLEMIEALNGLGRPIHTITLFAASMGWQIAQNLGDRYILKNGILMSHRAKGGFEGEFGGTSPNQVESRFHMWTSRLNELDAQTVKRTNGKQTMESYQKSYASELWLTGTQAIEGGYADKIVLVKCDKSLSGASTHSVEFFGMHINYDLDNCPLNTTPMNIRIGEKSGPLTAEQKDETVKKFKEHFDNKQKQVVPMYW